MNVATSPSADNSGAPRGVRRAVWLVLALALSGAGYLIWARGEAMIVDLSALAGKVWCF